MKVRRWRVAAVAFVVAAGLAYGAAWALTPYSGIARAVAWLDADTGDINRFPQRAIAASTTPRELEEPAGRPDVPVVVNGDRVDLDTALRASGTAAFLVARGTAILDERYFAEQTATTPHTSFSVAKSFLSAVVGAAVDRNLIALDDPITRELPELAERDPRFEDITIRDLLTMSSGIRYDEQSLPWSDDALTYYAADLRELALERSAVEQPPGSWHYNNYNPLLMALILERAAGRPVSDLLHEWIWQPAGLAADGSWSLDSPDGFEKSESGVNAVPRDYLRFGMLYRDGGSVDGRRVLPRAWVKESVTAASATPVQGAGYGLFWWVDAAGKYFYARGNHGQFVFVFPEHDVVIVRLGSTYGDVDWVDLAEQVAAFYGT